MIQRVLDILESMGIVMVRQLATVMIIWWKCAKKAAVSVKRKFDGSLMCTDLTKVASNLSQSWNEVLPGLRMPSPLFLSFEH